MKCPKCLNENDNTSNFCIYCGTKLQGSTDNTDYNFQNPAEDRIPTIAEEEMMTMGNPFSGQQAPSLFDEDIPSMFGSQAAPFGWDSAGTDDYDPSNKEQYKHILDKHYKRKVPKEAPPQKVKQPQKAKQPKAPKQKAPKQPKKQKKSSVGLVILGILLLLGVSGVAGFIIGEKKLEKMSPSNVQTQDNSEQASAATSAAVQEPTEEPEPTAAPMPTATSTPTPIPTATPIPSYSMRVMSRSEVNIDENNRVYIAGASATSVIEQTEHVNEPYLAFDYNDQTNWQEGVSGDGIGEAITAGFYEAEKIQYITFRLGNWKSDYYFFGNNYPTKLTLSMDGVSKQVEFSGHSKTEYVVEIIPPCETSYLNIVIDEVSKGSSWQDTVITDVGLYRE